MHEFALTPRLLCIDDDAVFLQALSRKLHSRSFSVTHAYDAIQGYRLAAVERPDVIITDYCMPFHFGTHLLRQLRNDTKLSRIPVIVVSGRDVHGHPDPEGDPMQSELLQELGARHVLRKPLKWDDLYAAIDACVAPAHKPAESLSDSTDETLQLDALAAAAENDVAPAAEKTLLIVEDDSQFRQALQERFERVGFQVIAAGSGKEAIALAREHGPDAIMLDVQLPDMYGFEVAQQLNDYEVTYGIPVNFISETVGRHFPEINRLAGARYLLRKFRGSDRLSNELSAEVGHAEDRYSLVDCLNECN